MAEVCAREGCRGRLSPGMVAAGVVYCSRICDWADAQYAKAADGSPSMWAAVVLLNDALSDYRREQHRDQRKRNKSRRRRRESQTGC